MSFRAGRKPKPADLVLTNCGGGEYYLAAPQSDRAKKWLARNLAGEIAVLEGQVLIEPPFIDSVTVAAMDYGLQIELAWGD